MKVFIRIPRVNIWVCEHECETITVDVAEGISPTQVRCKQHPKKINPKHLDENGQCKGKAISANYPTDYALDYLENIKYEMDLPTPEDITAMIKEAPHLEEQIKKYFDGTKLVMKPRTKKPMLFHGPRKE